MTFRNPVKELRSKYFTIRRDTSDNDICLMVDYSRNINPDMEVAIRNVCDDMSSEKTIHYLLGVKKKTRRIILRGDIGATDLYDALNKSLDGLE